MHRANRRLGASAKTKSSTTFKWVVKNVLLSPQLPRNLLLLGGGVFVLSGLAYSKNTEKFNKGSNIKGEIRIEKFDDRLNSYARAFPRDNQKNNPSIVVYDVPWYMKFFQNKADVDPLTLQTIIGEISMDQLNIIKKAEEKKI
mmetsp:Transcript_18718/g.18045  ORF Transcript_18718/g.18045 Transcript_18718/m.18045 type:complete len:143 (-) Transcript_18718:791-1219(-)